MFEALNRPEQTYDTSCCRLHYQPTTKAFNRKTAGKVTCATGACGWTQAREAAEAEAEAKAKAAEEARQAEAEEVKAKAEADRVAAEEAIKVEKARQEAKEDLEKKSIKTIEEIEKINLDEIKSLKDDQGTFINKAKIIIPNLVNISINNAKTEEEVKIVVEF